MAMKHWQETSRIFRTLPILVTQERAAALATVVGIDGSAYRRPGAKMLVTDDGEMIGSVSGGCLEADVREVALSVIKSGAPRLLRYDTGTDYQLPFNLGLGCSGSVEIFVQPATAPDFLETASKVTRLLNGDESFAVCTVIRGPRVLDRSVVITTRDERVGSTGEISLDRHIAACARELLESGVSERRDFGASEIFFDLQSPPPSLVVFGAGADTRPLARCAADVGFRVTVVDHRPGFLSSANYPAEIRLVEARADTEIAELSFGPRTYAVVKTHSLEHDTKWVGRLLATDIPYIGVLGPRVRTDEILRELRLENDERVFGPVGLDVGAEGPEQIAVSIVAELLARVSARDPMHLREKEAGIHAE
jgi:xanthine/CO dehydrogenase XdhC/CoxF family maturation factor